MKNEFINKFKSSIKLKITGKNVERFIRKLVVNKIELLNVSYPKYNEAIIQIYKKDYKKINEIKTIYEISILNTYGLIKIRKKININKYLILSFLIGFFLLLFLSNIIFDIEIVHNNSELRLLLKEELAKNGIKEKKFKKNYDEIQKIKKNILNKYRDKIEWLEIENVGTKYIVRVEERILNKKEKTYPNQDIIAKKSAILLKIDAESGEVIKNINDYVKQGETVISGNIKLYEDTKKQISAKGKIYGEVWYKVSVEYPLHYKEEKLTGKQKKVLVFNFLNTKIELFNFNKYKNKKIKEIKLIKNNLLPINLSIEKQKEINKIDEKYTKKEALKKATEKAINKIKKQLKKDEYIINYKQLKVDENNSTIEVEVFFSVCEDITDSKEIYPEVIEEKME